MEGRGREEMGISFWKVKHQVDCEELELAVPVKISDQMFPLKDFL